jgi:8-oxo-dGTP pyrophosphatase MutT (NUDIX family)
LSEHERVAIVDESNRVVGAATRAHMRAGRLHHRSTYILVFDLAGRLYVQKRTMTKDVYPGFWDPCTGGVVQAGESYEDSAIRELAEEMGIAAVPLETLADFYFEDPSSRVFGRAFRCVWDGDVVPQPEEVQFVEKMTPAEVLHRSASEQFTPDGLVVIRRFLGM